MTESEPLLSIQQTRVLGCMMEKHLATPKSYPLTFHGLMLACNQKSNRTPVMDLTEGQVGHTVGELAELGYARVDYGQRANKVSHRAPAVLKISREGQAVLAMLMLREPLTLAEIKARTERLANFNDVDAVLAAVEDLIKRERPLVMLIPKGPGRREDRYTHLLAGEPDLEMLERSKSKTKSVQLEPNSDKLAELEARIERLEQALGLQTDET